MIDPGRVGDPDAPARPAHVVVAHVSDLHLGAHDPDALAGLPGDVAAAGPALTVVTGDSTMRARTREFRQARALLHRLPVPLLVVAGNHDLPLGVVRRVLAPYTRYRRWVEADLDPVVRVPGLTALGLHSMPRWRWKNGRVTGRQAATVVDVLGDAVDDVRLLALHHPPFAAGPARLFGRTRLAAAIRAARVDVVLAGHTHVPDVRTAAAGPVVVVAGTATSHRLRGVACSWSLIEVDGREIVVRERVWTGAAWRPGRVVTVPRPGPAPFSAAES